MKKKIRVREKREREFGDIGRDCTALLHLDWCLMFWVSVFDLSISLSFSVLSIASFFGSIVSPFNCIFYLEAFIMYGFFKLTVTEFVPSGTS